MGDMADYDVGAFIEDDEIEISGVFKHETDKAYLIQIGQVEHWLPRSQIIGGDFEPERLVPGQEITLCIPAWLADTRGLA